MENRAIDPKFCRRTNFTEIYTVEQVSRYNIEDEGDGKNQEERIDLCDGHGNNFQIHQQFDHEHRRPLNLVQGRKYRLNIQDWDEPCSKDSIS